MDHEGAGCQTPKGPILCINNCGFFGSAATMNMCSKCHREMILKQAQAKMVDASFDSIMNENRSSSGEEPVVSTKPTNLLAGSSNGANVVKATEGFSSAAASVEMRNEGKGFHAPGRPILCTNCGFFGSSATMNMCPKCYKESILEQGEAKLVASSLDSKVNDIENDVEKNPVVFSNVKFPVASIKPTNLTAGSSNVAVSSDSSVVKDQEGPSRCSTCRKRVGLTGFACRCGNIYCSMHRYSDMHNCQFDYRAFSRDSIAKANPVVKTKKLDKI